MAGKQSTADKQGDGGRRTSIVFSKTPYLPPSVPCRISELQFSVQPPTEVVKYGEVEVFCNRLYKLPERTPHPGGPLDLSLGPGSKKHTCSTCGGKIATCSGHFGYIKLVLPVFHYGYATHILKILQRVCKTCSRVLLTEEERAPFLRRLRRPNVERKVVESVFKKVGELAKRHKYCPCCGSFNAIVKKIPGEIKFSHHLFTKNELNQRELEDELSTVIQYTPEAKAAIPRATEDLNPVMVLELFRKIADEELPLLDCAWRPEHLICTHLQVPPCIIRPSVDVEGTGGSNEDDATMRLKHIIDLNGSLRKAVEEGLSRPELVVEKWEELQCACALYINGDFQVSLTRREAAGDMMARPMKGFVQRLKGKQGRFRGNLSGKRVDFSGRTVISPDPNVRVDEVCVPQHMAQVLTYPETVTEYNIDKLRARVRSGPLYPGANFVRVPNGNLFALKLANRAVVANELKIGDVVERHLENGDVVLFNRQPSLHRVSIMAHRARVMPWRTLRFNECVCSPYNADFDGDEMNLHVPQTEEARAEAIVLMRSVNNLATPKNGEILIAATQDFLTSAFLMTCKDVFYTRSEFSQVCNYMGDATTPVDLPTPAILKPMELWTGKQLWSVLVRPNAQTRIFLNLSHAERTYTKKGEDMCPKDGWVLIRNSCLICGRLGKTTLGGNKGGLFGRLNTDYSPEVAAECMNRLAKMSARFLGNRGFTIGIDDVTPAVRLQNAKTDKMERSYAECDDYIAQFKKGVLQLQPGCNEEQSLEQAVTGVLNNIREAAGKVCMDTLHWHNAPLIMSQCGSKGSPINIAQMVACVGQQSVAGKRCPFGFRNRTLPHFPRGDRTPAGRGFVANSFYTGLSATEFFFHTMAGREGLVDTAVKTAETGYMSRRLMKALEDLYAHYDGTVRNASNSIVQLRYGDDGLDPVLMEGKGESPLDLGRTMHQIRAWTDIVQRVAPVPGRGDALLPEELEQEAAQQLQRVELQESSDVCSLKYREEVTRFLDGLVEQYARFRERLQLPRSSRGEPALEHVAAQAGVTGWQLQLLVEQCVRGVERKRVDSATTVGAISAQSIGEPGTQMTLKTFHFAGVASMNVTLGVPRIKEIINATRKIATPIIDVALAVSDSEHAARIVKGRLEKTTLGQVCSAIKMVVKHGVAYVSVRLDLERIQKLQLDLDAWQVLEIIRAVTKGRSKCGFGKVDVQARRKDKLLVFPSRDDKTETARSGSSALRKASNILFDLQCILANLPHVVVSGIPTLERAVINKDKPKQGAAGGERFNLLVEGVGLQAVMSTPGVNGPETKTNHITEVETVLGIEAARSCIIGEIKRTMESHGLGVDARHVMLLADVMTYKGRILGITRFGITDMKESTLHTASFERTTDQLFDAAVRGFRDEVTGVSEAIILGMLMPTGTGLFQVRHRHQPAAEQDAPVKRPDPLLQSFPLLPSYATATA